MEEADPFDPNIAFAELLPEAYFIRGVGRGQEFAAQVDYEDYLWAVRWRWSPKWSRGETKVYLRRNVQETHASYGTCPETGHRFRVRTQRTLFLHKAIMLRTGIEPETEKHVLVDHRDGNEMNCRRANLRWATHSMNCLNLKGRDK